MQIIIIKQHKVTGFFAFLIQLMVSGKDETFTPFVILSQGRRHGTLQSFADAFDRPGNLPNKMIFVNDDFGMGKINLCQFCIRFPHITYKIFYTIPFSYWDRREISSQIALNSVRENIQNVVFYGICQNTLVFTGLAFSLNSSIERISGKFLREQEMVSKIR